MFAFLIRVSTTSLSQIRYPASRDLPARIAVCPDSFLFSILETFDSPRPGDLKIGPCRGHEVIITSCPDDMGISAICILERIREACCVGERGKRKHTGAECLEEPHVTGCVLTKMVFVVSGPIVEYLT